MPARSAITLPIESMRTFKEKAVENELEMEGRIRLEDDKTVGLEDGKTVGGELEVEMSGICNPYFKLWKDSSYVKNMIAGDIPSSSIVA